MKLEGRKLFAGGIILALVSGGAGYALAKTPVGNANSSGNIQVIYSLDKKQNDQEIISLINNAHQYIYFAIYEFTLTDIADALVSAEKRGVKVEGITDADNSTTSYEAPLLAQLKAAGISVETQQHSGIMHVKAIVSESEYASGSYNWTYSATTENDEVLEIGTDPSVRAQYENIIKEILAANAGGSGSVTNATNAGGENNPGAPTTNAVYDYTEAKNHIGENAKVTGTIVKVGKSSSGTIFFDYCADYKNCPFSAVIFASSASNFPNVSQYQGENITISGPISSYQGQAEIILDSPSQISE